MKTFLILLFFPLLSFSAMNEFARAKKFLNKNLDLFEAKTLYCGCPVEGKTILIRECGYKVQSNPRRATRLEWEHIVPAEAFGKSFSEWRTGAPQCGNKKGRSCAGTNSEYSQIEGDMYNLYPEIGELNGLRSNYSMAELPGKSDRFGGCDVQLEDRKFEPRNDAKGIVARTYLHMENRYPGKGIVSDKNKKLFEAWNKMYPISNLECKRWRKIEKVQGYPHLFASLCK